jgi:hypothetical protein
MPDFVGGKGSVAGGGAPLVGAVSVFTDGETISGNGTKADPLTATVGFQNSSVTFDGGALIVPGMPLVTNTFGGAHVAPALADGSQGANATPIGIAVSSTNDSPSQPVTWQYAGTVVLTEAEWDAVAGGSGGLVTGKIYYVSESTAGGIQDSASSTGGHFIIQLGFAISPTELQLSIQYPQAA